MPVTIANTDSVTPGTPPRRLRLSLGTLAFAGSTATGLIMCVIVSLILMFHARNAVREETQSAFLLARAAATARLPTNFTRTDVMSEAEVLAIEIDRLRHVSAWVTDTANQTTTPRDNSDHGTRSVPGWLVRALTPPPQSDIFPIRQYPNLLGVLHVSTDPSDEIAKTWRNLRIILPLLVAAAVVMVALTMIATLIVQRRLRGVALAMAEMQDGTTTRRAPDSNITELALLTQGANTLSAHLEAERTENRHLQSRIVALAEAERARIASDLHDQIGPQLFALGAAIGQARAQSDEASPGLRDTFSAIERHAQAIQKSTRSAIEDLRPIGMDDASLDEMLSELVLDFAENAPDTLIELDADPAAESTEAVEVAIYRFIRESVLNALRHASPSHIRIMLTVDGDMLQAEVTDDGTGPGNSRIGLGLSGIEDRAKAVGASYTPPHRDGKLTKTTLRTPI